MDIAEVPLVAVQQFFEALRLGPPGGRWSFFVPGGRLGLELYVDFKRQRIAALGALRRYQASLSGHSVEDISSRVQQCLLDNLEATQLSGRIFDALSAGAYERGATLREIAHPIQLLWFATILHKELARMPPPKLYLQPLWGLCPPEPVIAEQLVWVPGTHDLNDLARAIGDERPDYRNGIFPPLRRWDGRSTPIGGADSWIGAQAGADIDGEAALQRIRGALSLALEAPRSRVFSGAEVQRGQIVLPADGRWTLTHPKALMAPLLYRPTITPEIVSVMRGALVNHAGNQRLQIALEYAAAAWEPSGRLGFLHNAIALDALFGDSEEGIRKSIRAGVERWARPLPDPGVRADFLWSVRNSLMHGEVTRIESCPQYLEYVERFDIDPAADQLLIVRTCVWNMANSQTRGAI